MQFVCPACKAVYRVSDTHLPNRRSTAKCAKCGAPIVFDPEQYKTISGPAQQNDWGSHVSKPQPIFPTGRPPAERMTPASAPLPVATAPFWKRNWRGITLATCMTVLAALLFVQFGLPHLRPNTPRPPQLAQKNADPLRVVPRGTSQLQASAPRTQAKIDPNLEELFKACKAGKLQSVKDVLEKHPDLDINQTDVVGMTPLARTAELGNTEIMRYLLTKGASLHVTATYNPILYTACEKGLIEVLTSLLKSGADINKKGPSGSTPLMLAAAAGQSEVLKLLIDAGADLEATNSTGSTALLLATQARHYQAAEILLQAGIDPLIRDKQGSSVLEWAIRFNFKSEFLQSLLDKGCDLGKTASTGGTPLILAAESGSRDAAEFFLNRDPSSLESRDKMGRTALLQAALFGQVPMVELLLKRGASIDAKDNGGNTSLALTRSPQAREILIAHGASKPSIVDTDNFNTTHAIPCEQRFVNGLARALTRYLQLYAKKEGGDKPVDAKVSPLDENNYKITFTVTVGPSTEDYGLVLSNQAADVRENLGRLARVLHQFAEARRNPHTLKAKKSVDYAAIRRQLAEQISTFDYFDLLGGLRLIEQKAANSESGPQIFYSAGEIYSWLALYKNANENRQLSDLLATEAVCNFLLGGLDRQSEPDKSFFEGLLLLSLDYNSPAESALDPAQPVEQLLRAYIRYDFEQMRTLAKNPKVNKRLQAYLFARALVSSGQANVANELFVRIMTDYPGYLIATEYVVNHAHLDVIRRHVDNYLEDLLEKHMSLVGEFTDTGWMARDRKLEQEARKSTTEDRRLEKWFGLHDLMAHHNPQMKGTGGILPGSLFNRFLLEDMSNAILTWYWVEDSRLGVRAEATKIYEIVKATYPDQPITEILSFKQAKDPSAQTAFLNGFQAEKSNRRTLVDVLKSARLHGRIGIHYLKNYRAMENPDAPGCFELYQRYKTLQYRQVAEMYLRNAIALNPYNYTYYKEMLKIGGGEEYIEKGTRHIGHLYGFLTAVADHSRKNDKTDQAILFYEKALAQGPAQQTAYMELGKIYEGLKQYDKAIETWQGFLKYDNNSLSAVEIQNSIGQVWLDRGEYDKAYEVFLESQKSGQARALLGFAEASEKTGRMLQSEKTYQRAAQRYPSGRCAAELGLFYLRQNNMESASRIFKEYKRYSRPGFYLPGLVEHCVKSGQAEKAIELVRTIESGQKEYDFNRMLADVYIWTNQHKLAADLLKPYTTGGVRGSIEMEKYWECMIKGGLSTPGELSSKAIPSGTNGDSLALETLAWFLVKNEYYEESLKIFSELFQKQNQQINAYREHQVVQFSIAWSMSGRDQNVKDEILRVLKSTVQTPWIESKILFLLGDLDQAELLKRADDEDTRGQAQLCVGLSRLKDGKKREAMQYLLLSLENMKESQEYEYATDITKKLASL